MVWYSNICKPIIDEVSILSGWGSLQKKKLRHTSLITICVHADNAFLYTQIWFLMDRKREDKDIQVYVTNPSHFKMKTWTLLN